MKYLVLLGVLAFVLLLFFGRGRKKAPPAVKKPDKADALPAEMLACAHCGVHLPKSEALFDVAGHPYCSAEHRAIGPR